ncbi:hypothetical protein [Streptomyces sp. NPDC016845]|uniref:hypothetical protein n=1 Tax=Streptomyces sp. NPDC016845 TaxID=3364972 RepID=UPI0037B5DCAF
MTRATRPSEYAGIRKRASGRFLGVVAATSAAVALTSCSGGGTKGTEATHDAAKPHKTAADTASAAPSPSETDPDAAVKRVVLDTYTRMWDEQAKAYNTGNLYETKFETYAVALARSDVKNDLQGLWSKGIVTQGAPTHDAQVTEIKRPQRMAPRAKITDCMNTTKWRFIYKKTGKPLPMPSTRMDRYVMTAQAEVWGESWKIVELTPSDKPC